MTYYGITSLTIACPGACSPTLASVVLQEDTADAQASEAFKFGLIMDKLKRLVTPNVVIPAILLLEVVGCLGIIAKIACTTIERMESSIASYRCILDRH